MNGRVVRFKALILCSALLSLGNQALAQDGPRHPEFFDNPLPYIGAAIACTVVGVPTCLAIGQRDNDELSFTRPSSVRGFQFGYFPSYVLDLAESTAFQRVEMSGYVGNALVALSHRRGVQEPNYFSSTSYRVAYSFDWRHLRPAFGIGARKNVNARNGDCFEIWLPVFFNPKMFDDTLGVYLETLWVIGPVGIRPELQIRLEYEMAKHASLAVGIGYFADYDNPEAELSVGPVFTF